MDRGGWWASPWVCKESDTTVSLSHAYVYVYTHTHTLYLPNIHSVHTNFCCANDGFKIRVLI